MASLLAKDHNLRLDAEVDALDVISSGLDACIFTADDLHPDFFNLSNRIAGDVFQKLTNYQFRAAIVIPENHNYGERIDELRRDHRRHPCIRFFSTIGDAQVWLAN